MSVKQFTTVVTDDVNLNRVQTNIQNTTDALIKNPFANLRLIANQTLSNNGITIINHGLGRVPIFIFVSLPLEQPSIIWSAQDINNNADMTLFLYSSNTVTVNIGVA